MSYAAAAVGTRFIASTIEERGESVRVRLFFVGMLERRFFALTPVNAINIAGFGYMRCFPTGLTFHRYRFAAAIISQPYTRKRNKYTCFGHTRCVPTAKTNECTSKRGRDKSRPYSHAGGVTRRLSMSKPQPRPCPPVKQGGMPPCPCREWQCAQEDAINRVRTGAEKRREWAVNAIGERN